MSAMAHHLRTEERSWGHYEGVELGIEAEPAGPNFAETDDTQLRCLRGWKAIGGVTLGIGVLLAIGATMDSRPFAGRSAKRKVVRFDPASGGISGLWNAEAPHETVTWDVETSAPPSTSLLPDENLEDGNVCEDDEEVLSSLCYKRCSLLTDGTHPLRTSAFTCCKEHPCGLANQLMPSILPCAGFDVNGKGGCPHAPGACLSDEELFLGVCYKKCSLLTNNNFPYRSAPATCCKGEGMRCIDPWEVRTRGTFDVGGGAGDNDTSTPSRAHPPLPQLTENTTIGSSARTKSRGIGLTPAGSSLLPHENLYDGNPCDGEEEEFEGLCYERCSRLTDGTHPIRTSAFSCCSERPCGVSNQRIDSMLPCKGFDVSAAGSCPHPKGACLADEELYLGLCYKQCSLLTHGKYPYRAAAATCCKATSLEGCLDPFATFTRPYMNVGGGKGDGNPLTPSGVHAPIGSLTEETHAPHVDS